jgi:hypothetical protein
VAKATTYKDFSSHNAFAFVSQGFPGKATVIPNAVRDLLFAATKKKQIPRAKFALGMTFSLFWSHGRPPSPTQKHDFPPAPAKTRKITQKCDDNSRLARYTPPT